MKQLPPFVYVTLSSLATISLIASVAFILSPSKATGPYEARGSGRDSISYRISEIEKRIEELAQDLTQEQDKDKEEARKTEIASARQSAHQGETTEKGPKAPSPGDSKRE